MPGILHDGGHGDAHDCERADEFTPDDGYSGEQELLSLFIRLTQDGMAVVEGVEKLC